MSRPLMAQFGKVADGLFVPADRTALVKKAVSENLITKDDVAKHLGVQPQQVWKATNNLNDRKLRQLCAFVLSHNGP